MISKLRLKNLSKSQLRITGLFVILLALPLILSTLYFIQDIRSRAALPDQLETEAGVISSSGVSKISNSNASGGQFVQFSQFSAPTPTSSPNPSIPPNAIYVPDSIDSTGINDVSPQLNNLIQNAPNGSIIVFKAGGTYRLDRVILVSSKTGITLEGNGARLDLPSVFSGYSSIGIQVRASTGTTIRNFTMVGNNDKAGTGKALGDRQAQHAIAVLSSDDTLIAGMDIRRTWGDCLYVNYATIDGQWSTEVTFRDSTCRLTGRNGVTINGGERVRVVNNAFDELGFMVIDIEPIHAGEGASDVVIRDNTIGSYSLTDSWSGQLLEACGSLEGSVVRDVTVTNNSVEGNLAGWGGRMLGLDIKVCGADRTRENFHITNNTALQPVVGPVMSFNAVAGVTVTGNTQPLLSGSLVNSSGSTNVTISNNTN